LGLNAQSRRPAAEEKGGRLRPRALRGTPL
jgi:hypothetical protein